MGSFNQLLLEQQVFIAITTVGALAFFIRAGLYFLSKDYEEAAALRALFIMRFGAGLTFLGLGGYSASSLMLPWPEPVTYGISFGLFAFVVLTVFAKPLAGALSHALRRRRIHEEVRRRNHRDSI